jgi:hypothetical protein
MSNQKQNTDWSDDDSSSEDYDNQDLSTIGSQPNRDFPPSDDDESGEEDYDMDNIRAVMANHSKVNTWSDIFKNNDVIDNKKPNNISKPKISNSINNNIKNLQTYEKRKFNPRLPPPDKYKKYNSSYGYKINNNEFPILK